MKNFKIEIHNEVTGRSYGASFESQEEANTWKESCIKKNSWGKQGEYTITETDLSLDVNFRNEQKIIARKKEYPSLEEVLHVIMDKGLDSPDFLALQEKRQQIKEKYSKE